MSARVHLSLAPLQGMTTTVFRDAFVRLFGGVEDVYVPFLVTSATENAGEVLARAFSGISPWTGAPVAGSAETRWVVAANSGEMAPALPANPAHHRARVIPQLLGNQGAEFRSHAHALAGLGFREINWNIGCPYPMVTTKLRGSGLLPHPERIREVLETACSDDSYAVSVKMRLGLESADEGFAVMEVLNEYPLAEVILHARTGRQMYGGEGDPDAFAALAAVCRHTLTWNGDLFTVEDWRRVQERFPRIDRFMLGRGALADPFLPMDILAAADPGECGAKPVAGANRPAMIRALHDAVFEDNRARLSGGRHVCDRMKEFWSYLSVHLIASDKSLKKLNKAQTIDAYLDAVDQALEAVEWSDRPWRNIGGK